MYFKSKCTKISLTVFKVISKLKILQLFSCFESNFKWEKCLACKVCTSNLQKGRGAKDGAILPSHVHHSEPKLKIPFWIIVEKNQGLSYISYGH